MRRTTPVAEAVLALGSNLGDRAANLRAALACLAGAGFRVDRASSVWETPPFPEGQPRYLNAAIRGQTALCPADLLTAAKACERALGRTPTWRWGPRLIDIDVLFYDDITSDTDELTVPHPRIAGRAFVLVPLAEIWEGPLPVLGASPAELLLVLDRSGIERTDEELLATPPGRDDEHRATPR